MGGVPDVYVLSVRGGDVGLGQVFVALPVDSAALPRGTMGGYGGLLLLLEPLQVPVLTARSMVLTLQLSNNTVFLLESDLEHFQPLRIFEIRMRLENQGKSLPPGVVNFG